MVDTAAAVNPIAMASQGSSMADMETAAATPPDTMLDCT